MASNYTSNPANNDIDRVRFLAQDASAPFHLTDEEIQFLISEAGDANFAAADAADMIAAKLGARADKTVGPLTIRYSEQATNYYALATRLRQKASKAGGGPVLTQTDRGPLFSIGMHDMFTGWLPPQVSNGEPDWQAGVSVDPE